MNKIIRNLDSTNISFENMFVQVPRELLSNLRNLIDSPTHVGYAYYFILLNAFLTKYCAYYVGGSCNLIKQKDILEFAGLASSNRLNYITKRNGLLHKAGIIEYTKDIPFSLLSSPVVDIDSNVTLFYSSDVKDESILSFLCLDSNFFKNYFVALPQFLTHREGYLDGTLVDYSNTYRVDFSDFLNIMSIPKGIGIINYVALYMVDSLKNIKYNDDPSLEISGQYVSNILGIDKKTFYKYIRYLEDKELISVSRNYNFNLKKNKINKYSIL